jgi:ornithine cyclodeaminase/alanine dehydrogenase-like protein (mu-crystallin family)
MIPPIPSQAVDDQGRRAAMPELTILTESDLRRCVVLNGALLDTIAKGFEAMVTGNATAAPAQRLWMPGGDGAIQARSAYMHGTPTYAVKIGPTGGGQGGSLLLYDANTNQLRAMLLDNGYLTKIQSAAAGAIAAKALSRASSKVAGILGAGAHAYHHAEALLLVRPIARFVVWDADMAAARALGEQIGSAHAVEVEVADTAKAVVEAADIVVTATAARSPILPDSWLHPGLHITAAGADAGNKNELAPEVLAEADIYVADSREQCRWAGELTHAIGAGLINEGDRIPEIGDLVSGSHPGRADDDQITVVDLTGTGVQDAAIAAHAAALADAQGLGTRIPGG